MGEKIVLLALIVVSWNADAAPPAPEQAQQESPAAAAPALFGVRILKTGDANLDWSVELPESCSDCQLLINEFTSSQNPKEFYFHVQASPARDSIENLHVKVDPARVRTVLAGRQGVPYAVRVPFTRTADGVRFDIPNHQAPDGVAALPSDGTVQLYTYLSRPGIRLRIEHADEKRRAGHYAKGSWPAVETQAALNLQFAAQAAIQQLRLDRTMEETGLGMIYLTGFDTNYPTMSPRAAHADYPPHWHMQVFWAQAQGSKWRTVPHLYLGPDGLLVRNNQLGRGETLEMTTPDGKVLFTQTITLQGHFVLATEAGSCRFTPVAGGFHTGVDLSCDGGASSRRIRARDDLARGRLKVYCNDKVVEEHEYDAETNRPKRSEISYSNACAP